MNVAGLSSVGSLLAYFWGVLAMRQATLVVLLPAAVSLVILWVWAARRGDSDVRNRILAGVCAGAMATLLYDVVRVPIALSGIPVFKAISYFGTTIMASAEPTVASEVVGWTYHLSNGIGFGLVYAAAVDRPRWYSAVTWGLLLELAMLATPYAEVFGYRLSPLFLVITISSHVVYGLALWLALQFWHQGGPSRIAALLKGSAVVPAGIALTAATFHAQHGDALPASPPAYMGKHLYVTWNVAEPDRVAAMWVLTRYVDPHAQFYFIEPFTDTSFGTPFDIPEADLRRRGALSATEVVLQHYELDDDARLHELGEMANLFEVNGWFKPVGEPRALALGNALIEECAGSSPCFECGLDYLDRWSEEEDRED